MTGGSDRRSSDGCSRDLFCILEKPIRSDVLDYSYIKLPELLFKLHLLHWSSALYQQNALEELDPQKIHKAKRSCWRRDYALVFIVPSDWEMILSPLQCVWSCLVKYQPPFPACCSVRAPCVLPTAGRCCRTELHQEERGALLAVPLAGWPCLEVTASARGSLEALREKH